MHPQAKREAELYLNRAEAAEQAASNAELRFARQKSTANPPKEPYKTPKRLTHIGIPQLQAGNGKNYRPHRLAGTAAG